jgi:hypothetical protein
MSAEPREAGKAAPKKIRRGEIVLFAFTLAAIGGIFALFFLLNASSNVWFVNGLDVPVDVLVDGSKVPVAAGAKTDVRLRAGTRDVRVQSRSGELIDEGPFDVPGGFDVVVYNVLGAAPLYSAEVFYGDSYGTPPEPAFFGGQRAVSRDNIDYVFTEPPSSISVKSGESRTRRRFDLVPGGWLTTVSYLEQQKHQTIAAAELCRAISRAEPEDLKARAYARHFTQLALGTDGQLRFLRSEMERRPYDVDLQLSYASTMRLAGRSEEVRAAYRPRFEANPTSVALGSVLIRVERFDEVRKITEALLASDPKSELARQNAAQLAFATEDWPRCAEIYASLEGTAHHIDHLEDHAQALIAQKKTPEALGLVSRALASSTPPDLMTSVLYARIAALEGAGAPPVPPTVYLDQAMTKGGVETQLWVKLQLGDGVSDSEIVQVKEDQLRRSLEIQRDAEKDPKKAWTSAAVADSTAFNRLPATVALLLAAEFARAGDAELANRILVEHTEYGLPRSVLLDYALSGTDHPDLWRLDPEWRAALDLVRARRLEELGQPAKAAYEAATRRDYFKTIVTRARNNWRSTVPPSSGGVVGNVSGKAATTPRKGAPAGLLLKGSSSEEGLSRQVVFKKSG